MRRANRSLDAPERPASVQGHLRWTTARDVWKEASAGSANACRTAKLKDCKAACAIRVSCSDIGKALHLLTFLSFDFQSETRANDAAEWVWTRLASRLIRKIFCLTGRRVFKDFVIRRVNEWYRIFLISVLLITDNGNYLSQGICEKTIQDVVERFWDIIEDININKVMRFLKDNIVGAVIICTAIIWIPASCVVSYIDRRRIKEAEKKWRWKHTDELIHPEDQRRIVHIQSASRQRAQPS